MKWLVAVFIHPVILSSVKNNKLILSFFIMLTETLNCLTQSNEYGKKYGRRQVQLIEHFIEHWESPGKVRFPFFTFPCLMKIHLLWLHRRRRNKRIIIFYFHLVAHPSIWDCQLERRNTQRASQLRGRGQRCYPPSTPLPQSESFLSLAAQCSL